MRSRGSRSDVTIYIDASARRCACLPKEGILYSDVLETLVIGFYEGRTEIVALLFIMFATYYETKVVSRNATRYSGNYR